MESQQVDNQQEEPKKPVEDQPKEQAQPTTQSAPAQNTQVKSSRKSSNMGLIIVIIVLVVLGLGVGGYFGVKYVLKKYVNKSTGVVSATKSVTASGKVSVKTVLTALMYPGASIADQKQDSASVYKAELTLSSADSVATIKAYYTKLVTDRGWKVTRQGSSGDDNYYLTVTDGVFEAEIDITKYSGYDTTDIRIAISGENLVSDGILVSPTSIKSTTTGTSTSNTSTSSSDYVISDSSTRVISESELIGFTPWHLKVARNEIYARHGRLFVHKDLQCYFAKKSWYRENSSFSESSLSTTENKNVATIQAYENKTGSSLASSDSGCDTNQ